ncbi:MAG: type II toxin-antitoxin system HicB family antitoxin [Candidatus Acidiferrum sp.]
MEKYLIVIEETASGYLAYSPDMPGCVCNGRTRTEAESNLRRALVSHLQMLRECGEVLPAPHSYFSYVELP